MWADALQKACLENVCQLICIKRKKGINCICISREIYGYYQNNHLEIEDELILISIHSTLFG